MNLHPTLRILSYLLSALALPGLSLLALAGLALSLLLAAGSRLAIMLRLAWRARWLFLVLGLGYAYSLPGPAALPEWRDLSPSWPGLQVGGLQMLRLLILLWLLDRLVIAMGTTRMMAGLHGLFAGLRWLGFPADRTTVRLGLTLQAMEGNALRLRDLTTSLTGAHTGGSDAATFAIHHHAWRRLDTLLLIAMLAALAGLWLA